MNYTNLTDDTEGPDPEVQHYQPPSKPKTESMLMSLRRQLSEDLRKRQEVWILGVVLAFLLIAFAGAALVLQLYSYNYSKGSELMSASLQQIGERVSTTAAPLPPVLLHKEEEYEYYKVPVASGTRLTGGKVALTCDSVGMRAICSGPSSCKYSDTSKCIVTPLSTNCNNPMYPLSKVICSGSKPRNCPQFEGVFSYMKNWYGGECGRVGSDWCANGDDFVAGTTEVSPGQEELAEPETYYGYCAKLIR